MHNEENVATVPWTLLTPRVAHRGSVLLGDSSPTVGRTLLSIFGVLMLLSPGCQPPFTDTAFTLLEVTNSQTQAPVTGANVFVDATNFGGLFLPPEECKTDVGPTNEFGRVHVPVNRAGTRPFLVTLVVTVDIEGVARRVEIENVSGATAVDGTLVVRVVDVDAGLPPPPEVEVVEGTNPVEIRFRGLFIRLSICSNRSDEIVWRVVNEGDSYFEGELVVGSTLMVTECPGLVQDFEPGATCSIRRLGRGAPLVGPVRGFTIYAQPPRANAVVSVAGYCLDANGAAVTCDGN